MPAAGTRGVIWDLDGVIIDSGEQHWQAWKALAAETHVTFTEADFRRTFGQRNADIIPPYWHTHDPDEIKRLADHKESLYREMLKKDARALPGALELIRTLHETGWKQALGSSAPLENVQLILDLLDLRLLLDAVVSGEEAPRGKPAPDIFLAAARALSLSPVNCVVIEDAVAGVQAARAAGMRCVAVTNGRPNRELGIADIVISSLTEIDLTRLTALAG
jgi:beta-phosphoglucomutase